jgi:hypothetical protein
MPGFLDMFNGNDPQQQGLLAAAAAILNASGPSTTPRSFGQVMGQGLLGFQQGQSQAQEQALRGMQMQKAGLELKQMQGSVDRMNRIRDRLAGAANPATQTGASADLPASPTNFMPGGDNSPRIGGPAWMQAFQTQQQSTPRPAPAAPSTPVRGATSATQQLVERLTHAAGVYSDEGDVEGANKLLEQAAKFMPEVHKIEVAMYGGKPVNVITFKDGTQKVSEFGATPNIHFADDGANTAIPVDGYTGGLLGQGIRKKQSPDSIAADQRAAADRAAAGEDAVMDPLAIRMTAQQYLAGDTSALQNFGRGAQGAKNLNAVRLEISRLANAQGLNGADIAAKVAEFGGIKAGQRTAGTRSANIEIAANEAAQLAPLAIAASRNVARSGFLPFGKAQIMFDSNTNDPNLRQFAMANTALANAYGQVMSRGGVASVSDKEHAKELLSTAFDQRSYEAAVQQLQAEIRAAQKAPREVRKDLSGEVSGRGNAHAAPAAPGSNNGWSITKVE